MSPIQREGLGPVTAFSRSVGPRTDRAWVLQGGVGGDADLRRRLETVLLTLFQEHNEFNSSMARSQTNTARIDGLRPGMVYVVQVRARTVAGYGKFSGKMCFQTLTDGKRQASEVVQGQHLGEGKRP